MVEADERSNKMLRYEISRMPVAKEASFPFPCKGFTFEVKGEILRSKVA